MANLRKVIYINEEDYSTLINGDSLVIDGTTYTYEENALYVIKNAGPPEYAKTAGYATNAGTSQVAVTDASGNNIAATYEKKPLIIEVNESDSGTTLERGTYDSITQALALGKLVILKLTRDNDDNEILYLPLLIDYTAAANIYLFIVWYGTHTNYTAEINNGDEFYYVTNTLAEDDVVVHKAETETITGNKTFTGTVSLGSKATAITPAATDNDTSVATTAFVHNVVNAIPEITTGQIVGRMHRDNVSGTGNLTITGASGEGFSPTGITTAGKYIVVVYSWSDTKTFGYNISFGSNNYTLSTTDGTISDKRELTVSAGALWSGTVTTAVSAGTTIIVEIYKAEKTTQALSVGTVALTNLYNDLDGKPTISSSTSSTSTTDIASSKAVKLAYDHGGVQSVNGQTGAVSLNIPDDSNLVHKTGNETISGTKVFKSESDLGININSNIIASFGGAVTSNSEWNWIKVTGKGGLNETLQQALDERNNLVTSVNGQTGAVTVNVGVTSFNGSTGAVTYTAPVTSVNGQTGEVSLSIPSKTSDITNDSKFIQDYGSYPSSIIKGGISNAEDVTLTVPFDNCGAVNVNPGGVSIISNWGGDGSTIDENGIGNVYINTSKGKAYYNSKEIATKDDIKVTSVNGQTGAVTLSLGQTNVIETVKVNGTALTPDANKAVDIVESVHVYPITSTELFEDLAVDTVITGVTSTNLDADITNGKLPILLFKVSATADSEPEPAILGYYGANEYYFYNVFENQISYLTLEHTSQSTTLTVKERGVINIIKNLFINGSRKNVSKNGTVNLGTYIETVKVNSTALTPDANNAVDISSIPASILTGTIPNSVTATTQNQNDNSTKIATTAYVDTAIDNIPNPMIFKGSLGTGGTITTLPSAATSNEGYTYKVITNGTYGGQSAKVGDTFVSDGSNWIYIPSGDEPSGTVTNVKIQTTSPIAIDDSSAITTSGTRTISHNDSGVTAGTYKSVTVDAKGHVTGGTNPTTLAGYGITDAAPAVAGGYLPLSGGTMTGPISFSNNNALPSKSLSYIVGIDAFADGGLMGWQSKSDFLANSTYWANISVGTSKNYITEPEVKSVKINGSSTNAASTENAVIQYDTTSKCIKFVFN